MVRRYILIGTFWGFCETDCIFEEAMKYLKHNSASKECYLIDRLYDEAWNYKGESVGKASENVPCYKKF